MKEVQTLHIVVNTATPPLQVTVSYRPAVTGIQKSVPILYLDDASTIKTKLQTLAGLTNVTVSVTVGTTPFTDRFWAVTFESVTGDVPSLTIVGDTGFDVSVAETVKGVAPFGSGDTFLVSYRGDTTPDLPYDISAVDMRTALNNLATLDNVIVDRVSIGNGFRRVHAQSAVYLVLPSYLS